VTLNWYHLYIGAWYRTALATRHFLWRATGRARIPVHMNKKRNRQWPSEKRQKGKQQSTKHTHKTSSSNTNPLKTGGELRCSGRVGNSCSTSGTHRVNLVTNPVINHEWGKDRDVFTTSGTYPCSSETHIFHNGRPGHGGYRKTFEVMTST